MDLIELNELGPYKIEKTKLDNYIELLFSCGVQEDVYYVLQYKKDKRERGKLSQGMSFEDARRMFNDIIEEENQLGARLDSILPSLRPKNRSKL